MCAECGEKMDSPHRHEGVARFAWGFCEDQLCTIVHREASPANEGSPERREISQPLLDSVNSQINGPSVYGERLCERAFSGSRMPGEYVEDRLTFHWRSHGLCSSEQQ